MQVTVVCLCDVDLGNDIFQNVFSHNTHILALVSYCEFVKENLNNDMYLQNIVQHMLPSLLQQESKVLFTWVLLNTFYMMFSTLYKFQICPQLTMYEIWWDHAWLSYYTYNACCIATTNKKAWNKSIAGSYLPSVWLYECENTSLC